MICLFARAQNLIPNPSFEEIRGCPSSHTTLKWPIQTIGWFSPSYGTPDLFSACAFSKVSTPSNFTGDAFPPDGQNYIGMFLGDPGSTYREYLMCKLNEELKPGNRYEFHFYAKPTTLSTYISKQLSIAFTSDSISIPSYSRIELDHHIIPVFPPKSTEYVEVSYTDNGYEARVWFDISYTFTAKGSERYLILGDFTIPDSEDYELLHFLDNPDLKPGGATYYLFDNLSLTSLDKPELYAIEKPFSLEKIYFEFDSYSLPKIATEELEELANYLFENRKYNLEIYGNTDNAGTEAYNEILSQRRADAVKGALIALGVQPDRLSAFGVGEKESIYAEDALNRRTEFILVTDQDRIDKD